MEERLFKRRNTVSAQLSLSSPTRMGESISSREYNELINLLASRNKVLEEIRYVCSNGKENVPVSKLRKILAGNE